MNKKEIKEILYSQVDRDNLVKNLIDLINIKSVNPFGMKITEGHGEVEIAEYYKERMLQLCMETHIDQVDEGRINVFGKLKGSESNSSLMLAGHLDTVDGQEEQFHAYEKGERIYGRGACDMKAALAVYLEAARVIVDADLKLKGDLIIGGIADEEFEMLGSRYVNANGPAADACIIGEPTELYVCPANKGQVCLIISFFGKSVHSSVPEKGVNAIEKAMKALAALTDYHKDLRSRKPHPLCGTGSFSAGVIKGGIVASAVPDRCDLEIDRRILPGETKEDVYRELTEILDHIAAEDKDFKYELSDPTFDVASNSISESEPVVQSLVKSYAQVTGEEERLYGLPFGTDAPNMSAPTVVCGPGSIENAHGSNEYCDIDQLEKAARMYLAAIVDLLI